MTVIQASHLISIFTQTAPPLCYCASPANIYCCNAYLLHNLWLGMMDVAWRHVLMPLLDCAQACEVVNLFPFSFSIFLLFLMWISIFYFVSFSKKKHVSIT